MSIDGRNLEIFASMSLSLFVSCLSFLFLYRHTFSLSLSPTVSDEREKENPEFYSTDTRLASTPETARTALESEGIQFRAIYFRKAIGFLWRFSRGYKHESTDKSHAFDCACVCVLFFQGSFLCSAQSESSIFFFRDMAMCRSRRRAV